MVNSYQNQPVTYGYQTVTNIPAQPPARKKTSIPYTLVGLSVGAGAGALVGWKTNPYMSKSGEVMNDFAQKTLDIFINKHDDSVKKVYKDGLNVLEGLKKVKTPEDLKSLLNNNKDFAQEMCKGLKQTPDEYLKTITKDNLQTNKDAIRSQINGMNGTKLQSIKNQIQACWDKASKTFKKSSDVSQDAFNAIEEATKGFKNKLIGKYALIGGLGTALLSFLTYQIIKGVKAKRQSQAIAQKNVQVQNINNQ